MTKYDFQTVGPNNDPCDGWCVVKYADNCHPQKIAEGLTRSEAAMFAAAPDLLAACKLTHSTMRRQFVGGNAPDSWGDDEHAAFTQLNAAIAKAEGKQ